MEINLSGSFPFSDQRINPDGLVHRKMEDIVYNKVHEDQDLFKVSTTDFT